MDKRVRPRPDEARRAILDAAADLLAAARTFPSPAVEQVGGQIEAIESSYLAGDA